MKTKTEKDGHRSGNDADDNDNNLRFFLGNDAVDVHIHDCPFFLKVMRKSDGIYCRVLAGDLAAKIPAFKMKARSLKQAEPVAEVWLAEMHGVFSEMLNRWRR